MSNKIFIIFLSLDVLFLLGGVHALHNYEDPMAHADPNYLLPRFPSPGDPTRAVLVSAFTEAESSSTGLFALAYCSRSCTDYHVYSEAV